MSIPDGYILQPRCIDNSGIMHEPPVVREIWFYLLRRVNYKDNDKFKRGTNFFNLGDIQEALHWHVGYRKKMYSKPQVTKAIRRLCERNMTETTKATRGLIITILNYDYYQDPKNYEGNDEENTKEIRRKYEGTHYKQEEEFKKKKKENRVPEKYLNYAKDFYNWLSQNGGKKQYTEKEITEGAKTIEKLSRIDKYDLEEEIKPALEWGLKDEFWSAQVRSLAQLRKKSKNNGELKFTNIFNKYKSDSQKPNGLYSRSVVT